MYLKPKVCDLQTPSYIYREAFYILRVNVACNKRLLSLHYCICRKTFGYHKFCYYHGFYLKINSSKSWCIWMHACIICVRTYKYACMYIRMCVCMYVCMYVCVYVLMYVPVYVCKYIMSHFISRLYNIHKYLCNLDIAFKLASYCHTG